MEDIRKDLVTSMTMAAFIGIAWYVGVEVNASLFLLFKRRRGLYFWSCALASWGVILQPVCIILADFGVWNDAVPAIVLIYLTWFIMVVPQSWVLYSRLHLLMHTASALDAIKYVLIFNSVVFAVPTMVIGTLAQATTVNPKLPAFNLVWDRIQLVVFFVQEAALSILYIVQTRKYLRGRAPLVERSWSASTVTAAATATPSLGRRASSSRPQTSEEHSVLWHLIYANLLILALDVALLGIQCANMFHLQGAFKPCVYGVKLKLEFVILNRLLQTVRKPASPSSYSYSYAAGGGFGSGAASARRQSRGHNLVGVANGGNGHGHGHSLWHKKPSVVEPSEDSDAVQLVESVSRSASASHGSEHQPPVYVGGFR
ncbi:uncharacterized protein MAM_01248 [Metarhizium album ARSEF 1941]|uniref:Integral membrane protein n=1 Tax=Metarhizium album (strain ARSEF 1941) TaxID=1081103 RepID=A0A0B2X4T5_METAS|nr:uncharacterized protein MAM_01248 [Metarhizium album ARSEF 1941]KHO00470.1 integral membrane protein [Metarhizium album ARSEF 1941]